MKHRQTVESKALRCERTVVRSRTLVDFTGSHKREIPREAPVEEAGSHGGSHVRLASSIYSSKFVSGIRTRAIVEIVVSFASATR